MKLLVSSLAIAVFLVGCGGAATTGTKRADARTDLITDQQDGVVDGAIKTTGGVISDEVNTTIKDTIRGIFR